MACFFYANISLTILKALKIGDIMTNYTLNIKKAGNQLCIEGLHRGDTGMREFSFSFVSGALPFVIPEKATATLFARLPNGSTVFSQCEIRDNTVAVPLSAGAEAPSLTSVAGMVECELRLTGADGSVLTSPAFSILVEDILQDDNAIEAESSFSALTAALSRVLDAEEGLSSKINKAKAEAGNVALFSEEGELCDGGKPHKSFIVYFDESKDMDEENYAALANIIESYNAGIDFNVKICDDRMLYPAEYTRISANSWEFSAFCTDYMEIHKVRISKTSTKYTVESIYETDSFNEKGYIPASQDIIANWANEKFAEKGMNIVCTMPSCSLSKNYSEILNAVFSQKTVYMTLVKSDGTSVLTFSGMGKDGSLYFTLNAPDENLRIKVSSDSTAQMI